MAELRESEAGAEARRQRAAAAKGMDLSKPDRAARSTARAHGFGAAARLKRRKP